MGNGKSESMTTPQAPAIQVQGLEKSYKELRGVDFEAARESKSRAHRSAAARQGPRPGRG
jgi:hypothetical protein